MLTSSINMHPGLDIYSSVIPQAAGATAIGLTASIPAGGILRLSKWNETLKKFDTYKFQEDDNGVVGWITPAGIPGEPSVGVAESFFIDNPPENAGSLTWNRTFPVGP